MDQARIRGAMWLHLAASGGQASPTKDPNALVPAAPFAAALGRLDEATQRGLGHDYAVLWGRTFGTLMRHLRGHPEQALRLFVEEVFPFLRGDRRAARLESSMRGHARLVLQSDLPAAYMEGLVAGFIGRSGARATVRARGHEMYEASYHVAPADRLVRMAHQVGSMRVPFMVAALVAALVGVAGATTVQAVPLWRVLVVLGGVLSVQGAANALHDMRGRRDAGPFQSRVIPAWMLHATVWVGYTLGVAAGIVLFLETPGVVAWAVAGLIMSLLYALMRDQGLGPLFAVFTYGPLVATGALHALVGPAPTDVLVGVAVAGLPLGALAGAVVYVGDLADRPLDQAAGRRTLVVRLPRPGHLIGYAVLVQTGGLGLVLAAWYWGAYWAPYALGAVVAGTLIWFVHRHLDDPRGLAPARLATLALHAATGAALISLIGATP